MEDKRSTTPENNQQLDGAENQESQTATPTSEPTEFDQVMEELEQVRAQAADNLDQAQRAQAELRNYRRRMEQEMQQVRKNAGERLIAQLLPVVDDFNRAINAIPDEQKESSWSQGILLIERKLWSILEREGVRPIEAVGQEFDPTVHEAVTVDPDAGAATTVVEEFQRGYTLNDRVIRPAMVKVGKASNTDSQE